jgi:hypothetical protein
VKQGPRERGTKGWAKRTDLNSNGIANHSPLFGAPNNIGASGEPRKQVQLEPAASFGGPRMRAMNQGSHWMTAKVPLPLAWRALLLFSSTLIFGAGPLRSQCPDNGQTKIIKPSQGTGYYFYRFLGDSSFVYFVDGESFSFNEKDDPGRTFFFIDDMGYESVLMERADLAEYVKSPNPLDILRAQAKHEQEYFKGADPSMLITDFGPSTRKNPDGSDDRTFYLWKKESAPGKQAATQYMLSTLVKNGVVVLSLMVMKPSVTEGDVFLQIQKYTSHFDTISSEQCEKVLAMPIAH